MFKNYYELVKPGIIYGNAITLTAGFALASRNSWNLSLFFAALVGLSLIIASACISNNYIDRDIDAMMERTKNRPLVTGKIQPRRALVIAFVLGLAGILILMRFTNMLTVMVALAGFLIYVMAYTRVRRHTVYGVLVGSLAGAVPPVVGYVAVSNILDMGAALLFAILVLWQMPHFYSISISRMDDYKKASIPVAPLAYDIHSTKISIVSYVVAFNIAAASLVFYGYSGMLYLTVALFLGIFWLTLAINGFWVSGTEDKNWARNMFLCSLVVLMFISLALILNSFI